MLYDAAEEPGSLSSAELRAAYLTQMRETVESVGVADVAAETGIEEARLRALANGEDPNPEFTLREAAAILATEEGRPDAEAIVAELRDHLLMGMTTAVLDVDAVAAEIDVDLTGQEVQQALEGRNAMRLRELAAIHGVIAAGNE